MTTIVPPLRRLATWAAPFLVALVGYLYADRQLRPPFTGDEPHYALEAFSLADDGDRDLTNDYASIERVVRAAGTATLQPQAVRSRPDGPLISIHGAGLAALLVPAARLGGSVSAMRAEMIVLAAIGAWLLFSIMAKLVPRPRWLLWVAWASVAFSLPLVGYATRLYPEMPASVLVLLGVRLLMAQRLDWRHVFGLSIAVAALPWLHVRFGIVGAGMVIAAIVRLHQARRGWWPALLSALLVPLATSVVLLSLTSHAWYGTWSPAGQLSATNHVLVAPSTTRGSDGSSAGTGGTNPSSEASADRPMFHLADAVHLDAIGPGLARGLFSARNGWLPFMPVGLLALAGLIALAISGHRWLMFGGLVALAYVAQIASTSVLPGLSLPGRFEVVVLPLIAVPLVLTLSDVPRSRYLFWPLAAVGAVITAFGVTHAGGLVMTTPGKMRADLGGVSAILSAWPVVSREPTEPPARYPVNLCDGGGPAGRCEAGDIVSRRRGHGGLLLAVDRSIPAGDYTAILTVERYDRAPPDALAARFELASAGTVFAEQPLRVSEIPVGSARSFTQDLRLLTPTRLETRVTSTGAARLALTALTYNIMTDPLTGLGAIGPRYPDALWVLVWLVALVGLAVALALPMRRQRRRQSIAPAT